MKSEGDGKARRTQIEQWVAFGCNSSETGTNSPTLFLLCSIIKTFKRIGALETVRERISTYRVTVSH